MSPLPIEALGGTGDGWRCGEAVGALPHSQAA
jgi:hypothetical protein